MLRRQRVGNTRYAIGAYFGKRSFYICCGFYSHMWSW